MREAHTNLNLDDMHFNVIKEYFLECFKNEGVAASLINEISRILETFRIDIVVRHSSLYDICGGDRVL